MAQHGFFYDANNCIGCKTCQVACKDSHQLPLGVNPRKVRSYQTGVYPKVGLYHVSMTCNHCAQPACMTACGNEALYRDAENGLVLHDKDKCIGCGSCTLACPYDAITVDEVDAKAVKCDGCLELQALGERPACEAGCPMRVLEFGPMEQLRAKYDAKPLTADFEAIPNSSLTQPNFLCVTKKIMFDKDYDEVFN